MFEKEAKNYAKDCEKEYHTAYGALLDAFQDGAEFGCNKAKEIMEIETENKDLKAQIKKMKNCNNCKNFCEYLTWLKVDGTNRTFAQKKAKACRLLGQCKNNELLEIKE